MERQIFVFWRRRPSQGQDGLDLAEIKSVMMNMAQRGRLVLLASWLVVRLHWAVQRTKAVLPQLAGRQPGRIAIAASCELLRERWCLDSTPRAFIFWYERERAIQIRLLPASTTN